MTEHEMIEIEKHWCENCCNWDKEKVQMDGYSECKLTGTSVFGQEYGGNCKCFNVPAENIIVPPCKVGDTVWYLNKHPHISLFQNSVYKAKVVRIVTTNIGTAVVIQIQSEGCCEIPDVTDWGITVFLTKEEAEQALAKMKGGLTDG